MIETLRKLVESLASLPEHLQQEAVEQIEPVVDCLIDRHWDEMFANTPDHVFDQMVAEVDAKVKFARKPVGDRSAQSVGRK